MGARNVSCCLLFQTEQVMGRPEPLRGGLGLRAVCLPLLRRLWVVVNTCAAHGATLGVVRSQCTFALNALAPALGVVIPIHTVGWGVGLQQPGCTLCVGCQCGGCDLLLCCCLSVVATTLMPPGMRDEGAPTGDTKRPGNHESP